MVEALGMSGTVTGQQALANQLAYLLPFTPAQKLQLLLLNDPAQRLDYIQELLDDFQSEMTA